MQAYRTWLHFIGSCYNVICFKLPMLNVPSREDHSCWVLDFHAAIRWCLPTVSQYFVSLPYSREQSSCHIKFLLGARLSCGHEVVLTCGIPWNGSTTISGLELNGNTEEQAKMLDNRDHFIYFSFNQTQWKVIFCKEGQGIQWLDVVGAFS